MKPIETAQRIARDVFKDADAMHEPKSIDWWRHFLGERTVDRSGITVLMTAA
ncbi:MAG: hypothetical protein ACKV2T_14605 [Kofleriaceae bacterium]